MKVQALLKIFVASAALLISSVSLAQSPMGGNKIGFGGKVGMSLDMGMLTGYETYYKTGNWQFEIFSMSSSVDNSEEFAKDIERDNVFSGGVNQGTITAMDVASEGIGFNVRWFMSGSTNVAIGYSQYLVNIDYSLISSDSSESYENLVTAETNALHVSFGNQWKLYEYSYFGIDWVSSFIPSELSVEALTQENASAPTDAGNIEVNDLIIKEAQELSGRPANYITVSMGIQF